MSDFKFTKYNEPTPSTPTTIEEARLNDGQAIDLAFTGACAPFDTVFDNNRTELATQDALRRGLTSKKRVILTALDLSSGRHVFIDLAAFFYNQLVDQQEAAPPMRWCWTFSRSGVGKDTRYMISPARPLTPREVAQRDALPSVDPVLLIAQKYGRSPASPPPGSPAAPAVVARPDRIAAADAAEVERALAGLPPEVRTHFLETFGVTTIADLHVTQTGPAVRYAVALANEHSPSPAIPHTNNIDA